MPKKQIQRLFNKVGTSRDTRSKFIIFSIYVVIIGILVIGVVIALSIKNDPVKPAENKRVTKQVDNLIKDGDCTKGLKELNELNTAKYNNEAQIKTLDYQMQCYAIRNKYDQAIRAAEELKKIYIKVGDEQSRIMIDQTIASIKEAKAEQ